MFEFQLPDRIARKLDGREGSLDSVTLGLRPEDIHDVEVAPDSHENGIFEAYVKVVEPMGSDKFLTLVPETGVDPEFTARVSPESEATEDELITLAANLNKIHLFNDSSGLNITQNTP